MARKSKEELTTKMHSELKVSDDIDHKHTVWTALGVIHNGLMTRAQAKEAYNLTEEDLLKYEAEWLEEEDQ